MTATVMGRRPAARGCRCRICIPDRTHRHRGPTDAACIRTVLRAGWQVMLVGSGDCSCCGSGGDREPDTGPAFAYTVGLLHRAGHPELAMSGLPGPAMGHVLNYVAQRVVDGHRVRPGDLIEGALANVPLTVDAVSRSGLSEIGTWSRWFHRRPVQALQLVWPSVTGVFAWQPGAARELDELQPPEWRVASMRVGPFAPDPSWPLPVAPDALATTCIHVREEGEPIRFVSREQDDVDGEAWVVHCGRDHSSGIDELVCEHIAHTVRCSPSLREVADLAVGQCAQRPDPFSPWRRGRSQPC